MKTERNMKFTLDINDRGAISTVMDIIFEIGDIMDSTDILLVNEDEYSYDDIDDFRTFIYDLWRNGNSTFELKED